MSRSEAAFVGVDTSNYTTSVALLGADGCLLANLKTPLSVRPGERGLRQSEALFAHTVNLPSLLEQARKILAGRRLLAVGVSEKPRNIEGSYMPCFLAGKAAAQSMGFAAQVPVFSFSHQCGHISAALYSAQREDLLTRPFYAFHVSGGTTDLCRVRTEGAAFEVERVGGTLDLNAGQLIDRVGVFMGLSFPAGVQMEALAGQLPAKSPIRAPRPDTTFVNLSGAENQLCALYQKTGDKALCAAATLACIGGALVSVCVNADRLLGHAPFVFAGGVCANKQIRSLLQTHLSDVAFARPEFSADNAVGVARLAMRAWDRQERQIF